MPAWLVFVLSAAAIVVAGIRLTRAGDAIADRTGLGGLWVGAILVAGATSLPELATGSSAVAQGNVSLAVGDLFGAGMVNMVVLAIADLVTVQVRILTRVTINQALVGALAIALTAIAAAGVLVDGGLVVAGLGWSTLAIGAGYVLGMRLIQLNRPEPPFRTPEEAAAAAKRAPALTGVVLEFLAAALVILVAAPSLAASAAAIAVELEVSTSFIGIALLAMITTLPEVVVSFTSVRAGSYDLAVGNLLGSNCFNMLILVALDVVDGPGSLLARSQPGVLVGALFAIVLMGQVLLGILSRSERRIRGVEPGPLLAILTYVVGLYLSYRVGP